MFSLEQKTPESAGAHLMMGKQKWKINKKGCNSKDSSSYAITVQHIQNVLRKI